ncbi:MAG: phosphonate metabolism transcriptional regulator PhnF [Acetobacteraceae bacterium]
MDEVAVTPTPGVALWRQIADSLQAEIIAGRLQPGARLPTEAVLAARFAVNRHTIRRALEELSRDGLITVEQGRGSFVTEDVLDYAVEPRTRFSEWIRRANREPSGRVLDLRATVADGAVARGLGLEPGAPVVLLERLGLADGRPVALGSHWFSPVALPGIEEALRREPTVTAALAAVGVADYRRRTTRVSARLPSAAEAALLRTARNRPLLVCENTNVDGDGRVVELGISRHPTPRVQVVFEP